MDKNENKIISGSSWDDELKELTRQFISRLSGRITELETQVELEHFDQVAQLAHRLSGAAGSYGISNLAAESKNLEYLAHTKDIVSTRKSLCTIQTIASELSHTEVKPPYFH